MAPDPPDVEILVHVTAPSRVVDDATYRQLAQAYLDFEPQATIQIEDTGSHTSDSDIADDREDAGTNDMPPAPTATSTPPASLELSFQSVLDNRASPQLRAVNREDGRQIVIPSSHPEIPESQSSWIAPPSQINDSYPLPNTSRMFVSPTRALQRYLARSSSQPETSPTRSKGPPQGSNTGEIPSSLPLSVSGSHVVIPSSEAYPSDPQAIIPVTPIASKPDKRESVSNDDCGEGATESLDITHISSSDISLAPTASFTRAESAPPQSKRLKTLAQGKPLARSSSDTGVRQPVGLSPSPLALEIWSPSPPVGVDDLELPIAVPERLAKLAADLSSRYRPEADRDITPLERGYWLVDCSSWSRDVRLDLWNFLIPYIEGGLAGWGVWCRRDAALDEVRLYCWGSLVKHAYLLLYLASGRHLKYTGAVWKDAEAKPVLRVLPYLKQS
ncbi:unnamed protein product [Clonostachys byssicola]|uniref:Uncharacterized protein n=1 Tax=Clonostachys byssicola TaxID=160290 RepID=A0A9N9UYQ9_9HYPO|nr:unnamed protein product [Clonostachys byssicola]